MIDAHEKSSIIRMFHVHHNYGPKKALIDITLDIAKNEFVFISGPSGAGKTTLLKLFYLGEPVSEGQVLIDGINLARIPRKRIPRLRRKFGIIFQDYKLIPTRTVYDDEPTGSLDDESAEVILELLKGVHIRGATVIIATHDKALMRKTGGQMLHLQQGRLETSSYIEKQYDNAIF
jgi:ABC-type ATPase involved in cell division